MNEQIALASLCGVLLAGNGTIFTETQLRKEFDEFEGKGELDAFLSRSGFTLADLLRRGEGVESCGPGRWRSVVTAETAHLAASIANKKGGRGGRSGGQTGFGRGGRGGFGSFSRGASNFVNSRGGGNRPFYGSAFRPPTQNNFQNQRPPAQRNNNFSPPDRFDNDRPYSNNFYNDPPRNRSPPRRFDSPPRVNNYQEPYYNEPRRNDNRYMDDEYNRRRDFSPDRSDHRRRSPSYSPGPPSNRMSYRDRLPSPPPSRNFDGPSSSGFQNRPPGIRSPLPRYSSPPRGNNYFNEPRRRSNNRYHDNGFNGPRGYSPPSSHRNHRGRSPSPPFRNFERPPNSRNGFPSNRNRSPPRVNNYQESYEPRRNDDRYNEYNRQRGYSPDRRRRSYSPPPPAKTMSYREHSPSPPPGLFDRPSCSQNEFPIRPPGLAPLVDNFPPPGLDFPPGLNPFGGNSPLSPPPGLDLLPPPGLGFQPEIRELPPRPDSPQSEYSQISFGEEPVISTLASIQIKQVIEESSHEFQAPLIHRMFETTLEKMISVEISIFVSIHKFYVRPVEYMEEFEEMIDDIQRAMDTEDVQIAPNAGWKKGDACLVEYKTEILTRWVRAVIMKVEGPLFRVFLIDIGLHVLMEDFRMRTMPLKYRIIPPYAISCCAFGIDKSQRNPQKTEFWRRELPCHSTTFVEFLNGSEYKISDGVPVFEVNLYQQNFAGNLVNVINE